MRKKPIVILVVLRTVPKKVIVAVFYFRGVGDDRSQRPCPRTMLLSLRSYRLSHSSHSVHFHISF